MGIPDRKDSGIFTGFFDLRFHSVAAVPDIAGGTWIKRGKEGLTDNPQEDYV